MIETGIGETAANAAAEAAMGGGGARRDSLGAGVKTVTAGWLLRDPLAERALSVHFFGRCVAEFRAPSSTGARASRRVVWLSQGTGECVEATLTRGFENPQYPKADVAFSDDIA